MDTFGSLNHSVAECKHRVVLHRVVYHVVSVRKCRRKALYGQLGQHLGGVFQPLAAQKESRIGDPLVEFHEPLGFSDHVALALHAAGTLSDSGSITEEASVPNLRAPNIRDAPERPGGMEEAAVMMTGLSWARVHQGFEVLATQPSGTTRALRIVRDHDVPNVSEKVARIIQRYTGYVRRVAWRPQS